MSTPRISTGDRAINPKRAAAAVERDRRDLQILALLDRGHSQPSVARALGVSLTKVQDLWRAARGAAE